MDEELRFHLEARVLHEIDAGRTPEEARRAALRAMDGIDQRKEECRDMRHTNFIHNLRRDVHYAIRILARGPGFTVAALLTLAIGIGASATVFSVVHGVVLRPLPYPEPERLMWIQDGLTQSSRSSRWGSCVADFLLWQSRSRSFDSLAAWSGRMFNLTGDGEAERVAGLAVTARLFDVLRVRPLLGGGTRTGVRPEGPARRGPAGRLCAGNRERLQVLC